jgi:riboflavin synthase
MFTGLIEAVGQLAEARPLATGLRLRVATSLAPQLTPGESLAVNGVCLTVIAASADEVHVDVSPETLRVTTIGGLPRGSLLNLERPLRADGRLGGHFVQGHVDATGTIEDVREEADFRWVTIRYPSLLAPYLIRKGSVAVDGISLTVAGLGDEGFDVQIVPFTWDHTNLRGVRPGDPVNLECDILGKYVVRVAELAGISATPRRRGSVTH